MSMSLLAIHSCLLNTADLPFNHRAQKYQLPRSSDSMVKQMSLNVGNYFGILSTQYNNIIVTKISSMYLTQSFE